MTPLLSSPELRGWLKIVCRQNNLDTGLKNIRWCFGSGCWPKRVVEQDDHTWEPHRVGGGAFSLTG